MKRIKMAVVNKLFCFLGFITAAVCDDASDKNRQTTLETLRSVESMDDFITKFKIDLKDLPFGYNNVRKKEAYSGLTPSAPKCSDGIPQARSIPVPNVNPHEYDYYPPCITSYRCGGCCLPATVFECNGIKQVNKNATVYRIKLSDSSALLQTVNYVDDEKCGCECIRKPSACSSKQIYDSGNCQCKCKFAPSQCPTNKQWSDSYCGCVCQHVKQCTGKFQWNPETCKCDCPIQNCPIGYRFDPQSCSCVKV